MCGPGGSLLWLASSLVYSELYMSLVRPVWRTALATASAGSQSHDQSMLVANQGVLGFSVLAPKLQLVGRVECAQPLQLPWYRSSKVGRMERKGGCALRKEQAGWLAEKHRTTVATTGIHPRGPPCRGAAP